MTVSTLDVDRYISTLRLNSKSFSEISNEEQLRISLSAIHQYQLKFKPERLILIFRDGWTADISTFHKYRVWRNSDFIKKIERNL